MDKTSAFFQQRTLELIAEKENLQHKYQKLYSLLYDELEQKGYENISSIIDQKTEELNNYESDLHKANKLIDNFLKEIKELKEANQSLSDVFDDKQSMQNQIERLTNYCNDYQNQIQELKQLIAVRQTGRAMGKALTKKVLEYDSLQSMYLDSIVTINKLKDEVNDYKTKYETIKNATDDAYRAGVQHACGLLESKADLYYLEDYQNTLDSKPYIEKEDFLKIINEVLIENNQLNINTENIVKQLREYTSKITHLLCKKLNHDKELGLKICFDVQHEYEDFIKKLRGE